MEHSKYSDLEMEHQIDSNEPISIKKRIEMYTKRFIRVFDVKTNGTSNKAKKSKSPNILRSKNNKNSQETNVDPKISMPPPTETIEDSFTLANNEKISETPLLKNEIHKGNITSNDTLENRSNLTPEHTSKSSNSDQTDYMARMESYLNNFNGTYAHLFTPKKDRVKRSSDEKNYKENKAKTITIGKVEKVIKYQTKKQNGESNMEDASKQDCMLSNKRLLEKTINQLRTQLKQFLDGFDMNTDTFKSSQNDLEDSQISTTNFVADQSEKLVKIDVLKIIELSRESRTRLSTFYSNLKKSQRRRSPERHLDTDGLNMKSNKSSSLSSKNTPADILILRRRSANFHRVFSETEQKLLNMIPNTTEGRPPELIKSPQKKEENHANEETTISTNNKQNFLQASEELSHTDSDYNLRFPLEKRQEKSSKDTLSNEEEDTNHLSDHNSWFSNEIELWENHSQHTDEKMELTPSSTGMLHRQTREFMSNTISFDYNLYASIPSIRGFLSLPNLQEVMMDDLHHGRNVCDECGSFLDQENAQEESYIQDPNIEAELSEVEYSNSPNSSYGIANCGHSNSSISTNGLAKCVCDHISLSRDFHDIKRSLEDMFGHPSCPSPDHTKDDSPSCIKKKDIQSQNIEEEELDDNVGQPEATTLEEESSIQNQNIEAELSVIKDSNRSKSSYIVATCGECLSMSSNGVAKYVCDHFSLRDSHDIEKSSEDILGQTYPSPDHSKVDRPLCLEKTDIQSQNIEEVLDDNVGQHEGAVVEEESFIQDQNIEAELPAIEDSNVSNSSYGVANCEESNSSNGVAKSVCDRDYNYVRKSLEEILGQTYPSPEHSKDDWPSCLEKKDLQSQNIEEEVLDDNVGQPEGKDQNIEVELTAIEDSNTSNSPYGVANYEDSNSSISSNGVAESVCDRDSKKSSEEIIGQTYPSPEYSKDDWPSCLDKTDLQSQNIEEQELDDNVGQPEGTVVEEEAFMQDHNIEAELTAIEESNVSNSPYGVANCEDSNSSISSNGVAESVCDRDSKKSSEEIIGQTYPSPEYSKDDWPSCLDKTDLQSQNIEEQELYDNVGQPKGTLVEEESFMQDQNIEAELTVIEDCNVTNSPYGVAKSVCDRDSNDVKKSLEEIIGQTYLSPEHSKDEWTSCLENDLQSQNMEEEEVDDDVGQPEVSAVPTQSPKAEQTTNFLSTGGNTQKYSSEMFSLPACPDEIIVDSSEKITDAICKNLQSTCVYFEEKRTVFELVGVLLPEESDMDNALEKLGTYEDFEQVLLQNNRMTSETNQTI